MINLKEEIQKIVFGVLFTTLVVVFIPIITIIILGFMKILEITLILSGISVTLYLVWQKWDKMQKDEYYSTFKTKRNRRK